MIALRGSQPQPHVIGQDSNGHVSHFFLNCSIAWRLGRQTRVGFLHTSSLFCVTCPMTAFVAPNGLG